MARSDAYLQAAADHIMIRDLIGRYGFAIDYETGDPGQWAQLFTEDGRFEIPIMKVVVEDRAALTEFAAGLQRTIPGLHHVMSNAFVDLDGDRATGRCHLNEFLLRPEAIYNNLQGWYEDEYRRVGDVWRFRVRKVLFPRDSSRVTTGGKIGEYFQEYLTFCRQFRRD